MSSTHESTNFFLPGPEGRLESVLWRPTGSAATMAAVVCHPHPLFGGTMHNKVVFQAAKVLDSLGVAVLRFNFRGAGLSEGKHDRGRGEVEDVRAALKFLAEDFPGTPLLVAGFSFGCWVGLRAGCQDARVDKLIGIGAPVNDSDFSYLSDCAKPKLFVHGGNDEYGDREKVRQMVTALPGENELVVVDRVDHFFTGRIEELGKAITEWLEHGAVHWPRENSLEN
jgi:alpha/beta superfamily hydrolase